MPKVTSSASPAAAFSALSRTSISRSAAGGAAYETHQTEIAIRMGRFFVEHLIRLYRAFDGDLTQVIILGEIGHHNTTRTHPAAGPRRRPPATPSVEDFLPCNAFSISQATGIPRETVRRKIAGLVRRGWVRQNARGEVFVTPAAGAHFMPVFNRDTLLDVLAVADELRSLLAAPATAPGPRPA
jgi:hypothetical protein